VSGFACKGTTQLLEPIGNHCRGTIFRDKGDLISDPLCEVFDTISKSIEGFYYGRFDLRVRSMEDLIKGETYSDNGVKWNYS
jgi:hypothetical protein